MATGSSSAQELGLAGALQRMELPEDAVVQLIGWDDDCDEEFLEELEDLVSEVIMDEAGDVVDGVLVFWRDEDGDLADGLLDALAMLSDDGLVWLLTPRPGRSGHMPSSDVKESVQVAGLRITSSLGVGADWHASRLTTPKGAR